MVYVNDIILVGDCLTELAHIKQILDANFKIKDLGQAKYFLGLEIAHSKRGISVSQRKYCLELLSDSGLTNSKPASTPLDYANRLHQDNSSPFSDVAAYRRLIGRLLYLTITRPDVAFATQQLSQFLAQPTTTHYKAAMRVLRYLKGSPGRGLFFPRDASLKLFGFSDTDWRGCPDTRGSISGFYFFLGSSLVSWKAKKQQKRSPGLHLKLNTVPLALPLASCNGLPSFFVTCQFIALSQQPFIVTIKVLFT